ncbi:restriction endonuclease subunit S [Gallionella capsiferriformans]|uniref:Restriction modification system DNA specificity domain n=1 Tax=Gallionella capsiferriformans (strain ES-2) TaxID=395494 RepID=D9SFZ1_GALCS|nr:restriction endonuclease subunit S [Gallionella capsiferriformans]ADL55438.1 restriction modification system DNA specificity domain [Gallionella capsiferriformans ES-2]
MSAPALRFDKGQAAWSEESLINLSESGFTNGVFNDPKKTGRGYKLINVLDMYIETTIDENRLSLVELSDAEFKKNKVEHGEIFFTRSSLVKEGIAFSNIYLGHSQDITFDGHLIRMRPRKDVLNSVFANYLLRTSKARKQLVARGKTATMTTIGQADIAAVMVMFPSLAEQTKIANFLTAVDQKLTQLTRKHDLLTQYKKGVMQQIFSQELRFKDDDGCDFPEWDVVELEKIAAKVNKKNKDSAINNVLTNSATQGIVSQSDYFERDIANQNNLGGYYIVEIDDFVYNPRISANALVGPIKRNNLAVGVMSPLYNVFRFKAGNLNFIEQYFHTTHWHDYMKSVSNSGARHDRMNITNESFLGLPIPYPCLKEQTKIANFLTAIDEKITTAKTQLEAVKQYKQGLLQQMFV